MTRQETINKAVAWAVGIADSPEHGYDQANIKEVYSGYFVTSDGRVFNKNGKELFQSREKKGYCKVHLFVNGKRINAWVHRLVATAFIPNPLELPQINHKDENPSNNCVDNLEWCTAKYNSNYGKHNANVSSANKGRVISEEQRAKISESRKGKEPKEATKAAAIINSKAVSQFLDGSFIADYPSAHEAGRLTGIHFSHISECCRGNRRTAGGYQWKFASGVV